MSEHDVITGPEAAALLRIDRRTLYTLCQRRAIPHRRVGRVLRFSRVAVLEWLSDHESRADASHH